MRDYRKRNKKIYYLYTKTQSTLRELAKVFHLSAERIRQIVEEQKRLHKLDNLTKLDKNDKI